MLYTTGDTITAIATPPAEGAIGVIRLSGPKALEIFNKSSRAKTSVANWDARKMYRVEIIGNDGETLDDGLAVFYPSPNSYTGEDLIEYFGHGGLLALSLVVETFISSGARAAGSGEFTRRAFVNGRMDLSQAEAVASIISAKSEQGLLTARRQLEGELSEVLSVARKTLIALVAEIEAYIDFPEDDLPPERVENYRRESESVEAVLKKLKETFKAGRAGAEGLVIVIAGMSNAGKSSLFNLLTARMRAIVTPLPGTTRDSITATLPYAGCLVTFVDTAGLRQTDDLIEIEGVRITKEWLEKADIVCWVIDGASGMSPENGEYIAALVSEEKMLTIWNKSDLSRPDEKAVKNKKGELLPVSCLNGEGIKELKEKISATINIRFKTTGDEITLTSERHFNLLKTALQSLENARSEIETDSRMELVAADLRSALDAVCEITGENISDDVLDNIFSRFCIGK